PSRVGPTRACVCWVWSPAILRTCAAELPPAEDNRGFPWTPRRPPATDDRRGSRTERRISITDCSCPFPNPQGWQRNRFCPLTSPARASDEKARSPACGRQIHRVGRENWVQEASRFSKITKVTDVN